MLFLILSIVLLFLFYFYILAGSVDGALGGGYYPPSASGPVATGGRKPNVNATMADSGAF